MLCYETIRPANIVCFQTTKAVFSSKRGFHEPNNDAASSHLRRRLNLQTEALINLNLQTEALQHLAAREAGPR